MNVEDQIRGLSQRLGAVEHELMHLRAAVNLQAPPRHLADGSDLPEAAATGPEPRTQTARPVPPGPPHPPREA